jgi:hypothetical protein
MKNKNRGSANAASTVTDAPDFLEIKEDALFNGPLR